ncbi:MAG: hypothetical protein ACOC7N_03835 [Chloroflexota bacterium]
MCIRPCGRTSLILSPVATLALVMISVALGGAFALAQSGGRCDLTWNTADGGGDTFSVGGGYTLGGTIGQPDADVLAAAGYTLGGGFWAGGAVSMGHGVYLPLVLRSH